MPAYPYITAFSIGAVTSNLHVCQVGAVRQINGCQGRAQSQFTKIQLIGSVGIVRVQAGNR